MSGSVVLVGSCWGGQGRGDPGAPPLTDARAAADLTRPSAGRRRGQGGARRGRQGAGPGSIRRARAPLPVCGSLPSWSRRRRPARRTPPAAACCPRRPCAAALPREFCGPRERRGPRGVNYRQARCRAGFSAPLLQLSLGVGTAVGAGGRAGRFGGLDGFRWTGTLRRRRRPPRRPPPPR